MRSLQQAPSNHPHCQEPLMESMKLPTELAQVERGTLGRPQASSSRGEGVSHGSRGGGSRGEGPAWAERGRHGTAVTSAGSAGGGGKGKRKGNAAEAQQTC